MNFSCVPPLFVITISKVQDHPILQHLVVVVKQGPEEGDGAGLPHGFVHRSEEAEKTRPKWLSAVMGKQWKKEQVCPFFVVVQLIHSRAVSGWVVIGVIRGCCVYASADRQFKPI